MAEERYLVALTGASGARYGVALLRSMKELGLSLDAIISEHAKEILSFEENMNAEELETYAESLYSNDDLFSPPGSGSVRYTAMIIIPCSMTTAGKIRCGIGDNLISRAAQVFMKEARRLIIVPRETPLSTCHLRTLCELSSSGVIVVPASPGFYHHPEKLEDLDNFMVEKVMGLLGKEAGLVKPFAGRR